MAATITSPANANITIGVAATTFATANGANIAGGKTAGNYVICTLLVNGSAVCQSAQSSTAGTTYSLNITISTANLSAIYTGATTLSRTSVMSIRAQEYDSSDLPVGTYASKTGSLTIASAPPTALNVTTANPLDLDNCTNIIATWTRPLNHSAFRVRVRITINGTTVITRTGFTGSCSFDPVSLGYLAGMISAMGGVSPRSIVTYVDSYFLDNTSGYYPASSTASNTRATGVIKSIYEASYVSDSSIDHNLDIDSNTSRAVNIYRMSSDLP
jgi:hypothetical protein